jgi:hypothetical protein
MSVLYKNSQLRLIINRMSFPAHRKSGSTEVQKLLASIPLRLVEVSQKEGWTTIGIDICWIKLFFPLNVFY